MSKSKDKKNVKYLALCRELLSLHNNETALEDDIKKFVNEIDSLTFFKNTTNRFGKLWISKNCSSIYFKLPNATCGKNYESSFKIESDAHLSEKLLDTIREDINILTIKGLEATGLTYNQDKKVINGVPKKSGDINLEINFKLPLTLNNHRANCIFIINPDPKSLWKNIPSDKNALFWKKDENKQEFITDDGWWIIGASKRGRSHAHEGKCRDDHFAISINSSTKWNIIAVADGAGSASVAREGARLAVTGSSKILSEKLDQFDSEIVAVLADSEPSTPPDISAGSDISTAPDNFCEQHEIRAETFGSVREKRLKDVLYNIFSLAVYEPIKAIHETIKQHENFKFRDFNTTLLLAAHKKINGRHFIASYWIGDGGIAVYCKDKSVTILGEPDSGVFAGQTKFLDNNALNKNDIYKRIRYSYQDTITALILMTDGITDPLFETGHNLNQSAYWDHIWKESLSNNISDNLEETSQNFLDWLDFWSQGNHDDRTVALLFKKETK